MKKRKLILRLTKMGKNGGAWVIFVGLQIWILKSGMKI